MFEMLKTVWFADVKSHLVTVHVYELVFPFKL